MAPIFALGGIGMPALQSLTTRQVDGENQGQLQGVLASIVSIASVFGPLLFSYIYAAVRHDWPGLIWISAILIYLFALPLMFKIRLGEMRQRNRHNDSGKAGKPAVWPCRPHNSAACTVSYRSASPMVGNTCTFGRIDQGLPPPSFASEGGHSL
jgi:MFS family permease